MQRNAKVFYKQSFLCSFLAVLLEKNLFYPCFGILMQTECTGIFGTLRKI